MSYVILCVYEIIPAGYHTLFYIPGVYFFLYESLLSLFVTGEAFARSVRKRSIKCSRSTKPRRRYDMCACSHTPRFHFTCCVERALSCAVLFYFQLCVFRTRKYRLTSDANYWRKGRGERSCACLQQYPPPPEPKCPSLLASFFRFTFFLFFQLRFIFYLQGMVPILCSARSCFVETRRPWLAPRASAPQSKAVVWFPGGGSFCPAPKSLLAG